MQKQIFNKHKGYYLQKIPILQSTIVQLYADEENFSFETKKVNPDRQNLKLWKAMLLRNRKKWNKFQKKEFPDWKEAEHFISLLLLNKFNGTAMVFYYPLVFTFKLWFHIVCLYYIMFLVHMVILSFDFS